MTTAAPAAPAAPAAVPASGTSGGSADPTKAAGQQPPASGTLPNGQQPPAGLTPAEKRQWKMAINGKETDLDITGIEFKDPKLEEKLKMLVQKGLGADEKFQHSAKVEVMLQQFIHLLKTDPVKALRHPLIGHDMRKLAEEFLANELEREGMDPEKRAIMEEREKLEADRDELKKQTEDANQKKVEVLREHYSKEYSTDILTTLKTSGLPQSPRTVQRMAHYMYEGLKRGIELKASDVLPIVRQDYIEDIKAIMGGLDEDALYALVGDEIAGKIQKAGISRLKRPGNLVPKEQQPPAGGEPPKPPKYRSTNDFEKLVNERI